MRVLQVVHALPSDTHGGTELYTANLASTLAEDHAVAVATPKGEESDVPAAPVHSLPDPGEGSGVDAAAAEPSVRDPAVDDRVAELLDSFDPDVVHCQHLKGLSTGIPRVCADRDVACLLTLHDFWSICHREQLVQPDGSLCSGPDSVEKCTDCYAKAVATGEEPVPDDAPASAPKSALSGQYDDAVAERTRRLVAARRQFDRLVSPSTFLRDVMVEYGTDPDRIVQLRNGIRTDRFEETPFERDGPLRVGYAGRITESKGVHVAVDAVERADASLSLDVFGQFDPDESSYHARLRERAGERVTFHGYYADPAAPYRAADVLVVPSLWYENSPLVIQEAFAAGVPVVASDRGGMAELVAHGEDGLRVPAGDADALAATLAKLARHPGFVEHLRQGVDEPTRLDDHAEALVDCYRECVGARRAEA